MSSRLPTAKKPKTYPVEYREFLHHHDGEWSEWVDGFIVAMSSPGWPHQRVADFLLRIMGEYVEQKDLGVIISAPFQMKLKKSGRQPDLLFVARDRLKLRQAQFFDGAADLVIEVVSPGSKRRDRVEKLREYEREGVREYWILEPDCDAASFHVLGEDGRYREQKPDARGVYRSTVIEGFWVKLQWLWTDPPPPAWRVRKLLGLR